MKDVRRLKVFFLLFIKICKWELGKKGSMLSTKHPTVQRGGISAKVVPSNKVPYLSMADTLMMRLKEDKERTLSLSSLVRLLHALVFMLHAMESMVE